MVSTALSGRLALVTGAGRNLGRSIALDLARRGADVVVNTASNFSAASAVAEEARRTGVRALPLVADVGERAEVDVMFDRVQEQFGRGPDIVVNNAALRRRAAFVDIEFDEWMRTISVSLHGAFYCLKRAVPGMIERGWGRVVNVSGQAAFSGQADMAHVVTAKAGVHGLTKALAVELGPHGITVNTLSPGLIRTGSSIPPEVMEARADRVPTRRIPESTEVATACTFLICDPGHITGQVVHVNGGEYLP